MTTGRCPRTRFVRSPFRRAWRGRAVVALLVASAAACGGNETPLLRVRVVTPPTDAAPSEGLRARSLEEGAARQAWPLTRADGTRDVFTLPADAPEGFYTVETADGGAIIGWHERQPPQLKRGAAVPVTVMVGRPATLYVTAGIPDAMLGDEWAVIGADDGTPVPTEVVRDESGMVALRFDPTRWRGGRFHVQGRFEDGSPTEVLTVLPVSERPAPILATARPAPTRALVVRLASAEHTPRVRVLVRIPGAPLRIEDARPVDERWEARFDAVPDLGPGRAPEAHAEGRVHAFSLDAWRRTGELRWGWPGASPRTVALTLPEGRAVGELQMRPAGADTYGLLSLPLPGDGAQEVAVAEGDVRLIVRAGESWALVEVPADRTQVDLRTEDFVATAHLRVSGIPPGERLLLRRHEGDRRVLAQGFALIAAEGAVEAALPPGTYDASVEGRSEARELTLQPGRRVYVELDADRR